ncbi:MAG: RpiB/LacA/LacB family sugar-phosphate isomerase [Patescibacteria group bacterium]
MKQAPIFLAADHAGYALKEKIKHKFLKLGLQVKDLSPKFKPGDDYPAHGFNLAKAIVKNKDAKGIAICGSSIGISMAANRIKGARAFSTTDEKTIKLAREHNDANIMTLSGWRTSTKSAIKLIDVFLKTKFSGAERHKRRIKQLG